MLKDKLDIIYQKQKELMHKLYPDTINEVSIERKEEITRNMVEAMNVELSEVLNEINWKPWKSIRKNVDYEKLGLEIIDVLHFLIETFIVWGFTTDQILDMYLNKNKENLNRQENSELGYVKKI